MQNLRGWIGARLAGWILLFGLALLAVMHILILVNAMPADFVWGGAITSRSQLYLLETLALLIVALFAWIVARRVGIIGTGHLGRGIRMGAWVVFAYMTLNILGNLASGASLERLLFAPFTVVLALLALRVAIE